MPTFGYATPPACLLTCLRFAALYHILYDETVNGGNRRIRAHRRINNWLVFNHLDELSPARLTKFTISSLWETVRNYTFDKPAITLTLMPARTGRDDPDSDRPRVANSNHKQAQHTDSHKGEAALGVVE